MRSTRSSLAPKWQRVQSPIRSVWRDANGIPREAILGLALGSLYADKRPNFLVEVSDAAYAADSRVHTVIAGGGPEAKSMHAAASTRPWLHMVGPVFGDDKVAALSTSTCMVMPGVGGLVIVDAFAAGLPLVIAENPHHPPEFDYVKADHNGVVLPSDVSADSFGREVAALVADRDRLAVLAEGSAADGALYTMEAMVERFACGVRRALKER